MTLFWGETYFLNYFLGECKLNIPKALGCRDEKPLGHGLVLTPHTRHEMQSFYYKERLIFAF